MRPRTQKKQSGINYFRVAVVSRPRPILVWDCGKNENVEKLEKMFKL